MRGINTDANPTPYWTIELDFKNYHEGAIQMLLNSLQLRTFVCLCLAASTTMKAS